MTFVCLSHYQNPSFGEDLRRDVLKPSGLRSTVRTYPLDREVVRINFGGPFQRRQMHKLVFNARKMKFPLSFIQGQTLRVTAAPKQLIPGNWGMAVLLLSLAPLTAGKSFHF